MNDMMNSVMTHGTGQNASLALIPSAGKTGTSQNFKDAWLVAYTAQFVGGVWIGNDTSLAMRGVTGGSLPADIWKEVMAKAHEGLGMKALPGTPLDNAFIQQAADASGLSEVPVPSPYRLSPERKPDDKVSTADTSAPKIALIQETAPNR
jgi:penicillin-binding protein 1A